MLSVEEIPPANLIFMQSVHHKVKEKVQQASSFPYKMFFLKKRLFFSEIPNKWHSTKIQRLEVLGCTNQTDCESKGMCSIVLTALNSSFHRLAESRSVWTLRRPDGERLAPGMRFLSYLRYGLLLCLYGLFACSYSILCNETTVVFFWSVGFVYEIWLLLCLETLWFNWF